MQLLKIAIWIVFFITSIALVPQEVRACSGGAPLSSYNYPIDYLLDPPMGVVAMGYISQVSESRYAGILTVQHYLREPQTEGTLLFLQESLEMARFAESGRGHPARCAYFSDRLTSGRNFIAQLGRTTEGVYGGNLLISDENGTFHTYRLYEGGEPLTFTYAEMRTFAERQLGTTSASPTDYNSPRPASVMLTTEHGSRFVLPADRREPAPSAVTSDAPRCPLFLPCTPNWVEAPNGVDVAYLYPVGSGSEMTNNPDTPFTLAFEGEAVVFSPLSDLIAVWTGSRLRVFATSRQYSLGTTFSYGAALIATHESSPDDPLIAGSGAWHPNGRLFAFSTDAGVWLLDIQCSQCSPSLIQSIEQPVYIRGFSPLGNYLALETAEEQYYFDLIAGEIYPDGIFSPDERLLAAFDTCAGELTPMSLYQVAPSFRPALFWDNADPVMITQLEWVGPHRMIYAACGDALNYSEEPGFDQPWCKVRQYYPGAGSSPWIDGTAFDYDPVTDSLAVLVDEGTIDLNGEQIMISQFVDGDILHIEIVPLMDVDR